MQKITNIEFYSGMDCPGGSYVTIHVNGEYQGRLYDLKQYTLGRVLMSIIEEEMCGDNYTCNSSEAKRQLKQLQCLEDEPQSSNELPF